MAERAFSLSPLQAHIFEAVHDTGLPATLDALATVCRLHAKWCREDAERREARSWDRIADELHRLSLTLTEKTAAYRETAQ